MIDLLKRLGGLLVGVFRSHAAREAEMAFLRQQLVVLRRSAPARLRLRSADRLIFVWLYRLFPSLLEAAVVFKPETLVRWHRGGFRLYWRCKSRRRVGRPAVPADIRDLIRTISRDNPLWGAPRIHGELLKLGIDIAQSTVAKYMSRRHGPGSPGWQAFLRNHTTHIAGVDTRQREARSILYVTLCWREIVWTPSAGQGRFWRRTVMSVAGLCPACSRGQWPLALMDCPPPEAPIWISRSMRIPSQRACLGSRSD